MPELLIPEPAPNDQNVPPALGVLAPSTQGISGGAGWAGLYSLPSLPQNKGPPALATTPRDGKDDASRHCVRNWEVTLEGWKIPPPDQETGKLPGSHTFLRHGPR